MKNKRTISKLKEEKKEMQLMNKEIKDARRHRQCEMRDYHHLQSLMKKELAQELQKQVDAQLQEVQDIKFLKRIESNEFASIQSFGKASHSTTHVFEQLKNEIDQVHRGYPATKSAVYEHEEPSSSTQKQQVRQAPSYY